MFRCREHTQLPPHTGGAADIGPGIRAVLWYGWRRGDPSADADAKCRRPGAHARGLRPGHSQTGEIFGRLPIAQVDDEMATSVPGVFALGDIRNTPFKQVVVAASDGCIAAMAIDRYLKGRKNVRVDWIHQ